MKKLALLATAIFVLSCSSKKEQSPEIDINQINGYWEIVQAQNPYGKNVLYSINSSIDYFEMKDSIGFRKKMKPNVNGSFKTSLDLEKFKVYVENDTIKLAYNTLYSKWNESVLRLNDSLMLIKNDNDFLYTYKRFKPIEN
jgi:hypothetical protein